MTPDAQRIAIAEACPDLVSREASGLWWKSSLGKPFDPLSDLNAMHEAEKVLSELAHSGVGSMTHNNQRGQFLNMLVGLTNESFPIHATAAQRAEAFLRTLGKWDDAK